MAIFPNIFNHSPFFIRLKLCMLNAENVVKPPQNPIKRKELKSTGSDFWSRLIKYEKHPMAKQPSVLTNIVPHGIDDTINLSKKIENQWRVMPPRALPRPIQR